MNYTMIKLNVIENQQLVKDNKNLCTKFVYV